MKMFTLTLLAGLLLAAQVATANASWMPGEPTSFRDTGVSTWANGSFNYAAATAAETGSASGMSSGSAIAFVEGPFVAELSASALLSLSGLGNFPSFLDSTPELDLGSTEAHGLVVHVYPEIPFPNPNVPAVSGSDISAYLLGADDYNAVSFSSSSAVTMVMPAPVPLPAGVWLLGLRRRA